MDRVRRHLTRLVAARLAVLAGVVAVVAGVGVEFGLGVALIVGGVLVALCGLLLVDVDEPKGGRG